MGWTKDEVDKYVAKVERNINSPREKNLKGFAFARLYREARDNTKAKRHLEAYLSVNESDFRGHRMMGQLFEETGNLEKALLSYRRSLDLNNTQHDLVLKVVELYCQVPVEPGRARAWADRAARLYPGHAAVFKLRMHLLESVGKVDYEQMEDLISEEMAKRPRDTELHIRLIKVYTATGRLVEAYSHCASVVRTKAFRENQEWWMCAADVFEKYMAGQDKMIPLDRDIGPGHVILDSHAHLMGALSQLLNLYLKTQETRECINLFYRLDHCLTVAHERKVRSTPRGSQSNRCEWDVVLTEMRGQLYLHCGTLILKLAKANYLTWPRALKLTSVCYTTCTQISEPDINTAWVARAPKNKDPLRWYHMACYRLSHAGHLLGAVIHKYGEEWLDNCISDWCTQQGQDEILNTIYSDHRDKSKSFLANDEEFFLLDVNLPSVEHLVKYDEVCVGNNPRSLELITWIGLHWYQYEGSIRPGVGVIVSRIFDGLRMDVPNIEQTAADTLCLRDLEAFIYAVIRTSASKFLEDQDLYIPDYQPQILPQQLCDRLTSPAQEEWWLAAYNLYAGAASVSHAGRVRATVQRGLEVIRALGIHGLHVRLLIYLAFNFGDKASYLKQAGVSPWYYEEHWKSLQARSLHYWKEALILLEKIERNENIPVRKDSLFPSIQNSLMKVDIKFNIQKARLILGEAALRDGKIEEAMEMFEQVKTIQGMWNLAQIYKYLANVEAQAAASDDLDLDAHSNTPSQEYYICLNKAKELLLVCIEKVPNEERRRQTLQDELNDIEDMLNEDPNRVKVHPRKQLDFRQLDFQVSRSSTTVSDVQESEDNFWLEQPQDGSSKDLIAKLSEVTLNNGYLQEQMAVRDQHLIDLNNKVQSLETELRELKRHGFSGIMSPTNYPSPAPLPSLTTQATPLALASPITQGVASLNRMSTTPTSSRQLTLQNGRPLESTPVTKLSIKSRIGQRIPVVTPPEPPKIDSKFFAGLSQTNSPEKRTELEQSEEGESEQGSVRHDSTSFDDGIHFEPIIPLPKKIELKTGEESEVVLFSKRAKLYRFDKDLKSWKERGHGNLKILSSVSTTQFRVLMRREHILKICANHLITANMELKPLKAGSDNSLVWTTAADFADETPKVEQLAVRFKLAEEMKEFKEIFESCKSKLSGVSSSSSPLRVKDQEKCKSEVSPKPGGWECSVCKTTNMHTTSICESCNSNKTDKSAAGSSTVEKKEPLSTGDTDSSLFLRFAPKPGSWECSSCLVVNNKNVSSCVSCGNERPGSEGAVAIAETTTLKFIPQTVFQIPKSGFGSAEKGKDFTFSFKEKNASQENQAASSIFGSPKLLFGPQSSVFNKPVTDFSFASPSVTEKQPTVPEPDATQKFPFEFKPPASVNKEAEETKSKKIVFGKQQPEPFSFAYEPSSTSLSSPLKFSFGKTAAPTFSLAPFGVSTMPNASREEISSSSPFSFSFGSAKKETPTPEGANTKEGATEKSLTFSASPSGALPGFDIDDDVEEEKVSAPGSSDVSISVSSETLPTPQQASVLPSVVPSNIPPQLFWQQQLEEKFKFGNLHKTEPLAGMQPVVVAPSSGKPDICYPASFVLSKIASKNVPLGPHPAHPSSERGDTKGNTLSLQQLKEESLSHGVGSQGVQRPELLLSLLQSKPKESTACGSNQTQYLSYALSSSGSSHPSKVVEDSSKTIEDMDDYSDDVESESEDESGSYHSSEEDEENFNANEDDHNKTVISQPSSATHQLLPQKSSQTATSALMSQTPGVFGRKFLTARSPLKKGQPKEDDCVIIYEIRAAKTDRDKASQLMLPPNFFNYARSNPCPGCLGCDENMWSAVKQQGLRSTEKNNIPVSSQPQPEAPTNKGKPNDKSETTSQKEGTHIFGASSETRSLSFASFSSSFVSSFGKKDSAHHRFPMAGQQLFGSPGDEDPTDDADVHFKPLIPLPDLIKVRTGEEDHTLLFSERARLYRFDASSSMWKERGIGDIKLLLDDKSGRGRVVMRRDQVHKLCANHWVTKDMELRTNSSSDRSWVWQTLADFSEETPSQEKLAIRFKLPETAARFKEVFEDLVAIAKKRATKGTEMTSKTSALAAKGHKTDQKPKSGELWTCQTCYCFNKFEDQTCVACESPKGSVGKEHPSQTINIKTTPVSEKSSLPSTKSSTPKLAGQPQVTASDGTSKLSLKPVFTIGRGNAPEEDLEEETYRHSPSKNSPSKMATKPTTPVKSPTSLLPAKPSTDFAFGSKSHTKFNFRLELSPDKEPTKISAKSPQTPTSPGSPGTHPEAEDDGIHFEPIIPLPKKVTKKTGEENEIVMFCNRAKLYRFDNAGNQWKERGVGEIKILQNAKSGKCRVLMRRDNVLKICANHQITLDMTLKPNSGSEKSWVWNTLADFADEVAKQETLAVRFKTGETALNFKDAFENAKDGAVDAKLTESEGELASSKKDRIEAQKHDEPASKQSMEDKLLQSQMTSESLSQDQKPKDDTKETEGDKEQGISSDFLFGSSDISSLSFASIASSIGPSPGIIKTAKAKQDFKAGPPLFSTSPQGKESESEGEDYHDDGPHFEPLITLPEKVEVRTGEEEEEVIFSHRAKLYRFNKETKEWKERGIGDIKILFHEKNSRVRILMRRDQILKICANHYVTPEMQLKPNGTSPKSWVWNTLADFSDEEVKPEQFAVRFKFEKAAHEFKEKFDECKEKMVQQTSEPVAESENTDSLKSESAFDTEESSIGVPKEGILEEIDGKDSDVTACVAGETPKPGFSSGAPTQEMKRDSFMDKFKAKPGTWECQTCLVQNNSNVTACVACQTPKPGCDASQTTTFTQNNSAFSLGGPVATGFSFNFGKSNNSVPLSFGSGITFGGPSAETTSQKPQFVFDSTPSTTKEDKTPFKPDVSKMFGLVSSNTDSEIPAITFGPSMSERRIKEKESPATVTEVIVQSKKVSSVEKAEADSTSTSTTETKELDSADLTLTAVIEPSIEEKRRAESLLLPEGFFLYERKQSDLSRVVDKVMKGSANNVTVEKTTNVEKEANEGGSTGPKGVFGASAALSFSSFSQVSSGNGFQFGGQKTSKGFAGQGTQLFSSPQSRSGDGSPEDEQDIYFKPVVVLPEIEVVTGEENEEKLFGHRTKLYRYDKSVSQWKERGVGEIKILKSKDGKKFRVLMRRDQIHKLCANHCITVDMNLVPNAGNDRSWVWHTSADLSEEEPKPEQLAVRFKSAATAQEFKKVFEECQKCLRDQTVKEHEGSTSEVDSTSNKTDIEAVERLQQLSKSSQDEGVIKPEVHSTSNEDDIDSVEGPPQLSKSSQDDSDDRPEEASTSEVGIASNAEKEQGLKGETSKDTHGECSTCYVPNSGSRDNSVVCEAPRQGSDVATNGQENLYIKEEKEKAVNYMNVQEDNGSPTEASEPRLFGTQSISSLSFTDAGKEGIFGQAFSSSEPFPLKGLNDQKPSEDKEKTDDQDGEYHNVSGDHIHFDPIIPLPEKVDVVTGEENEEVVFKERAKLYRYDKDLKQWKERGVGEMKILSGMGRSRIVMRRDQIHKLCANHLISTNMTLTSNNSDRSWVWQTFADFSEEVPKPESLAIRFKTVEIAQEFKKAFEECRDGIDPSEVEAIINKSELSDEEKTLESDQSADNQSRESISPENEAGAVGPYDEDSEKIPSLKSKSNEAISQSTKTSSQIVSKTVAESKVVQSEVRSSCTVKKEEKQFTSLSSGDFTVEKSTIAKSYQEQVIAESNGTRTEQNQNVSALALQEQRITSSSEDRQFESPSSSDVFQGLVRPSILNPDILSSQQDTDLLSTSSGLFRQPELTECNAQRSTQEVSSSQVTTTSSTKEGMVFQEEVRQAERRTMEVSETSSSVVTSNESEIISCSPEITKMLQEIQDKSDNKQE